MDSRYGGVRVDGAAIGRDQDPPAALEGACGAQAGVARRVPPRGTGQARWWRGDSPDDASFTKRTGASRARPARRLARRGGRSDLADRADALAPDGPAVPYG